MASTPAARMALPKIDTNSLHDPVAEFVPVQDPEGDMLPELPGGLNRMVMPSPRGGFYANKVDPASQADAFLKRDAQKDGNADDGVKKNLLHELQKDMLDDEFSKLMKRPSKERFERAVVKDKIDGVTTPRSARSTPWKDRVFDSLTSPRRAEQPHRQQP